MSVTLGTFIRERRQDLGLTQEQLAERVGPSVRQAEISRLEKDRITLPSRARLEQLAAALEVSLGDLLVRTGWLQEGLRDQVAPGGQSVASVQAPGQVDEAMRQDLLAAAESIAGVQAMVAEAAQMLERAEGTIATLLRALNVEYNTRGVVRPPVGVLKDWETAAVFEA
jgi:transcriptional regulator with XRE-family HTH domain